MAPIINIPGLAEGLAEGRHSGVQWQYNRAQTQAHNIVNALRQDCPLNHLTVTAPGDIRIDESPIAREGDKILLQRYLAARDQITPEASNFLYGVGFDLFSMHEVIRRSENWEVLGISERQEAEALAKRFEEYTFAQTPEVRDTYLQTLRQAMHIHCYPRDFSRGKGKKETTKLRRNLKTLLDRTEFSRTIRDGSDHPLGPESLAILNANYKEAMKLCLDYQDSPWLNPLDSFTEDGRARIHQRSDILSDLSTKTRKTASEVETTLLLAGNDYRSKYVQQRRKAQVA